jgi:hypothetical protein
MDKNIKIKKFLSLLMFMSLTNLHANILDDPWYKENTTRFLNEYHSVIKNISDMGNIDDLLNESNMNRLYETADRCLSCIKMVISFFENVTKHYDKMYKGGTTCLWMPDLLEHRITRCVCGDFGFEDIKCACGRKEYEGIEEVKYVFIGIFWGMGHVPDEWAQAFDKNVCRPLILILEKFPTVFAFMKVLESMDILISIGYSTRMNISDDDISDDEGITRYKITSIAEIHKAIDNVMMRNDRGCGCLTM